MAVKNSLQASPKKTSFVAYLTNDAVKANINRVVGGQNGPRFMSAIISAVNVNPALQECTNQSILSAALLGETLKLSPSPQLGHYYMVPFGDKNNGKVAQFILGYKGYIQLALRSGQYKKLNVLAVKEGELVRYDPLNEEIEIKLIEDEVLRENTPTVGYFAFFEYNNGFRKTLYWSRQKMENHALRYSRGYAAKKGYTFWEKDFDAMAYKTMLRQLISKWGIMSIDLIKAFETDYTIEASDGSRAYVETDDLMETPPVTEPEPEPDEPAVKAEVVEHADDTQGSGDLEWV